MRIGGWRGGVAVLTAAGLLVACSGGQGTSRAGGATTGTTITGTTITGTTTTGATPAGAGAAASPRATTPATPPATPRTSARRTSARRTGTAGAVPARPLAGVVVVVDPGHAGGNARAAAVVDRLVDIGTGRKPCDTTGTQTAGGYPEHAFTWDVATRLATRLRTAGARVVLTRSGDAGVGPCITGRAAVGNAAAAAAGPGTTVIGISVHADGGPATGLGFHVIEPLPAGGNDAIVAPSRRLGTAVRDAFRRGTGEPYATYTATNGVARRGDLGGLNLSRIPKVFVECGNMRNAGDARRLTDPAWRDRAAAALARGLQDYVAGD